MQDRGESTIVFYVNDKQVTLRDPDPRLLLADYLRSDEVGLTGTKKVCGQGGCGACTVTLHRRNEQTGQVESVAVNSCLRPVCTLDGQAITTVEGVGNIEDGISPLQRRLAENNATQCGYCTPGWVMSMHSHLVQSPDAKLNQREIEELFDGNLCRCTGFRPILYAMRQYASDFGPEDRKGCMTCVVLDGMEPKLAPSEPTSIPPGLDAPARAIYLERDGYTWYRPVSLAALLTFLGQQDCAGDVRMVVGNTSIGIYGEPAQGVSYGAPHVRVDIAHIPELYGLELGENEIVVGAATTYTTFLQALRTWRAKAPSHHHTGLDALEYFARRTAGRIVRDAASLAGNTMLVVQHRDQGIPFPSDMFTALTSLGAAVDVICPGWSEPQRFDLLAFAEQWQADEVLQKGAVILRYHIPLTQPGQWARTFKVALREVNAHSIVNGGFCVGLDDALQVTSASLVLGGIGPIAFHLSELERWLVGRPWDGTTLGAALLQIRATVTAHFEATRGRMRDVPDEGFTESYRTHLAETFFYQFFVWVTEGVAPERLPADVRSAGERPLRPASRGTQNIQTYPKEYPVSLPVVKVEGYIQTTGEAKYTHDIPLPPNGLDAALVVSTCPLAQSFSYVIPVPGGAPRPATVAQLAEHLRGHFPGFFDLVTCDDIPVPAANNQAYAGPPDLLLCEPSTGVTTCGQNLAVVLANDKQLAINVAYWVQTNCIHYQPVLDADGKVVAPILNLDEAIQQGSRLQGTNEIAAMERPGSDLTWVDKSEATVSGVHCKVLQGKQASRSPQIHFYLETQAAVAIPGEQRSSTMTVITSTQNPGTVRDSVRKVLGLQANCVHVEIKRLGGGYGGKGPRTPWAGAVTAIAAAKHRRAVRLHVPREVDSAVFGHSNPLLGNYAIAVGTGQDDPQNRGRIMGLSTDFFMDAGNTADCSPVVMDCVQLRSDNAYFVQNYATTGTVYTTNTTSNTSFRSLEAVSGILIQEDAIEAAAYALGMQAEDVREKNLYQEGQLTPFGQALDYCYMKDVWSYTKRSWRHSKSHLTFEQRAEAIERFNAENRWTKRGIAMVPVKYGMGFNATFLERGDALVDIYSGDGTVLVRHGGVEMGQGVNTQVTQLVAQALGIPIALVQIGVTSTAVIPDPISTGASTGTSFNGGAAQRAALRLRRRLEAFCKQVLIERGPEYCAEKNIDYWNHEDGWRHVSETGGLVWASIVGMAGSARVNLSTQAQHNEQGGGDLDTGLTISTTDNPETVQNFVGFTYSAGISEVELNVLTGEVTILRSDLVYDMGKSLNPATDVGQVEGAFVQGIGRVLLEEVVLQPSGDKIGQLNTPNTWGYKIPASVSIPLEMNINLFPREVAREVPENPNLLMSSKESGEPPLCLAVTVYFALKRAMLAARRDRGHSEWFRLDLPCTVQRVREACLVDLDDLTLGATAAPNEG